MTISKYIKFHLNGYLRRRAYYLYCVVIYFLLAFVDDSNLWIDHYDEYVNRCADQQIVICIALVFVIIMVISEEYLEIYKNLFCIYIQNPGGYFGTMAVSTIIANVVPFILGQIVFLILNAIVTGFMPWELVFSNILIVIMEIISLVLFSIGLFLIYQKLILVVFMFIFTTLLSAILSSSYISIPLIASITKVTSGGYYTFPISLWVGRILIISICLLFFYIAIKRFTSKQNT